jgi:glycosyltransferase 2 family protein
MILRSLGSQPDLTMTIRAYVLSLFPKYVPGKFLAHGLRAQLSTKAGISISVALKSLLLEAIFALGSAAAVSIPGAIYYYPTTLRYVPTWVVIAAVIGFIALVAIRRFEFTSKAPFSLLTENRNFTGYLKIFLLYILVWLVCGVAHWCLANALNFYGLRVLPQLIVAAAASWALGFVSFIAPAGLGVREAVLYFFVYNWMEQGDVILFVTLSRLLMFGVEVFLTLVYVLYLRSASRQETAVMK